MTVPVLNIIPPALVFLLNLPVSSQSLAAVTAIFQNHHGSGFSDKLGHITVSVHCSKYHRSSIGLVVLLSRIFNSRTCFLCFIDSNIPIQPERVFDRRSVQKYVCGHAHWVFLPRSKTKDTAFQIRNRFGSHQR